MIKFLNRVFSSETFWLGNALNSLIFLSISSTSLISSQFFLSFLIISWFFDLISSEIKDRQMIDVFCSNNVKPISRFEGALNFCSNIFYIKKNNGSILIGSTVREKINVPWSLERGFTINCDNLRIIQYFEITLLVLNFVLK